MDIPGAQLTQIPPSSQAAARVFVDSANQPLRVFVESTEVFNRPKIVRTLKSGGATICHEVGEAEIIIVNPEEASGKQLIEAWSGEKVILGPIWVQESFKRERVYLADENWGGSIAVVVEGAGSSTGGTVPNHLPTPRETPSEPKIPQDRPDMQHQRSQEDQYMHPASPVASGSQFPAQMSQQVPNGQAAGAMPVATVLSNYPNAQVTLPAPLVAQMMAFMSQQGMNPAMGIGQMPQMPMNLMQGQGFPQAFTQQGMPFNMQAGVFPQSAFPVTQQAAFSPQMMSMGFSQPMEPQSASHNGQFHGSASSDTHERRNRSLSESHYGSPMDEDDQPASLKRKVRTAELQVSGKKGKSRGDAGRSSKHPRLSETSDDASLPYTDSTPPPSTQIPRVSSNLSDKLFINDDGEQLQFFVQVEIRNRSKIADAIKRNGGKMVSEIANADFVILGHPTTRNFEEWLRQSGYFGKLPVKPQWVFDCVTEGEILDFEDYVYEGLKIEKKRGRPSASGQRYVVKKVKPQSKSPTKGGLVWEDLEEDADEDYEEDEDVSEPSSKQKQKKMENIRVKKEKKAKAVKKAEKKTSRTAQGDENSEISSQGKGKAKHMDRSPARPDHWEPSPPPPTRVEQHVTGKNLYTKEDNDYCDEYIPILLARDPGMTSTSIAEKLHEKMPHHSLKSWTTRIAQPGRREKLEKMRRRAEILSRKAINGRTSSHDVRQENPPPIPSSPAAPATQPAPVDPFKTMTSFFADGQADTLADNEVWGVMARKYPQFTAQDWEKYWVENNEEIALEVSRLTGLQASQEGDIKSQGPKAEPE